MRVAASLCALAGLLCCGPAAAQSPAPLRHLVYTFTWGTSNATETHVSGIGDDAGLAAGSTNAGAASGMATATGGISDQGTISVDVLRQQPDKGLVVSIGEQARDSRSAPPATCVVFGNTTVVCDPQKKINDEELTLLRFLGSDFVDPSQLDANRHWKESESSADYASDSDFTISNNAGGIMTINEVRHVKESTGHTAELTATIHYDFNRHVPTGVTEYLIERREAGEQYTVVKTETVLQLQTDSMGKT